MSEKKHKELKKKAIDMDTTLSDYLVQSAATVSRTKLDLSSDK